MTGALRQTLDRVYPPDQRLVADLGVTIVGIFMWFGAALTLVNYPTLLRSP